MMTRAHVKAMFEQSGYGIALLVLRRRKARGEFEVYLNHLRRAQLQEERWRIAAQAALPSAALIFYFWASAHTALKN